VVASMRATDRPSRHSTASRLFEAPVVASDQLDWRSLPELKVDESDPQAATLAQIDVTNPRDRLSLLRNMSQPTVEIRLATAHAALDAGEFDIASQVTAAILADDPWEWRAMWIDGLCALARTDADAALGAFNAVYGQLPGELAPKLALALACEQAQQPDVAEQLYLTCLRTDANYTAPAAFGLARIRAGRQSGPALAAQNGNGPTGQGTAVDAAAAAGVSPGANGQGELAGAISALDMVPVTSRSFVAARRQRAALLVQNATGLESLAAALDSVESVSIDPKDRAGLRVQVLQAALDDVSVNGPEPDILVGGVPAEGAGLRDGLERAYRDLATMTDDHNERIRLVDNANRVRRWTWR